MITDVMITEVINLIEDMKIDEEIRITHDCILKITLLNLKCFLFIIFTGKYILE